MAGAGGGATASAATARFAFDATNAPAASCIHGLHARTAFLPPPTSIDLSTEHEEQIESPQLLEKVKTHAYTDNTTMIREANMYHRVT